MLQKICALCEDNLDRVHFYIACPTARRGTPQWSKKMRLIQMVMLLTGLFMAAVPVGCTRKDARNDKDAVKKTRTMGIWLAAAAAIWLFCSVI